MTVPLTTDMVKARIERNLARGLVHLRAERDRLEEKRRDGDAGAVERCTELIVRKRANIEEHQRQLAEIEENAS